MRTFIPFLLLCMIGCTAAIRTRAQGPIVKVQGKESNLVYLQKLSVDVSVNGSVATTTWTMLIANRSDRILEGQLEFPLPEGISVSRYALDLNGVLRDAVPVEKEKGTKVFENIERRRVDPGLLEKVDGNIFRTRIYPISQGKPRMVLISYDEELSPGKDHALRYHLPLAFSQPLEEFNLTIHVLRGSVKPEIEEHIDGLTFDAWEDTWSANKTWTNYKAERSLTILVPKSIGGTESMMQAAGGRYIFNVTAYPQAKKVAKPQLHRIALLWDVSLSGLSRDREKELSFLDAYFGQLREVEVTLVPFSNTVRAGKDFSIHGGEWESLRSELEKLIYDGGTQMGAVDPGRYQADEYLLFSDGHSTYGRADMPKAQKPLYAIVSTAKADLPALRYQTDRSGGEVVQLERSTTAECIDQLSYESLYFMGIKPQAGVEESYPNLPTPVINGISVAGYTDRPSGELILQFGYGGKVTMETKMVLDFERQQTKRLDLARVWAQKKIAALDRRYEENRQEIGWLGRRYGIATRNTSLIVLETVEDYVTYAIEPPADLRPQYDAIIKQRGETGRLVQHAVKDNARSIFKELMEWWKTDFKRPVHPVYKQQQQRLDTVIYREDEHMRDMAIVSDAAVAAPAQRQERRSVTGSISRIDAKDLQANSSSQFSSQGNSLQDVVVVAVDKKSADPGEVSFKAFKPEIRTAYLAKMQKTRPGEQYSVYLESRKENLNTPVFYFNSANFFFDHGRNDIGLRILSNIAELESESYELYKLLGYRLRSLEENEAACGVFKKVLDWRPFEPQSYRDYALALEQAGHYQAALDTLYKGLERNYDQMVEALYPGIEETILPEINNIVALKKDKVDVSRIPRDLLYNMPVDIRVVLNWNMNDTDIDLWVTDPDGEKCYYSHRNTGIGGRISQDFTRGLGPEQFMLKKAVKGKYKVQVDYYGDTQVKLAGPTTVMAEIYTHYGTPQQSRRLITLQMQGQENKTVLVGEFEFN